jgi:hypothetical protein
MATGAVSRYKLSWNQKFDKVKKYDYMQVSVYWFSSHYEFVLGAGAKAKTVTNNLPLLSVLGVVICYLSG